MTEQEKHDRAEYAENMRAGKRSFRIPEHLAIILGDGNTAGYADYKAGRPKREFDPETSDFVYVKGYDSGYEMASKGKMPQCVALREMSLAAAMKLNPDPEEADVL